MLQVLCEFDESAGWWRTSALMSLMADPMSQWQGSAAALARTNCRTAQVRVISKRTRLANQLQHKGFLQSIALWWTTTQAVTLSQPSM